MSTFETLYTFLSYYFFAIIYTIIMKNIKKNMFFINFLIIFMLFSAFFTVFLNSNKIYAQHNYYYTYKVEHLFTHCLIAFPEVAFSKNNHMAKHYQTDCITASEFKKILIELYKNNYVLVNINDCFNNSNGQITKNKLQLPIGKKALILSFDDVNYDSKKIGLGMVDKIILDNNNKFATSTIINGKEFISYNNEFIPILEDFIKKNPDFSLNNARGVINLTGYDGILGYRTSHTNKKNRSEEIEKVTKIVNKLKQNGWQFACHSYGHYHMNKISDDKFAKEIKLWQDEVEPIIGNTSVYVYPFGEWQVFDNGEICTKHKMLQDAGFELFCGVGMKTFFSYLPNKNHKVLFMDRKCVDGRTLKQNRPELNIFFDPLKILDLSRTI